MMKKIISNLKSKIGMNNLLGNLYSIFKHLEPNKYYQSLKKYEMFKISKCL
jgi:hypothetical protein